MTGKMRDILLGISMVGVTVMFIYEVIRWWFFV